MVWGVNGVSLTSERSPPAGCAARAPWSAWDARPGESSPDTARSWWGARTCYTHLWTKPSSRLCSTCALKRMRRTSWGVKSWHCPFMMGRSNMLHSPLNEALQQAVQHGRLEVHEMHVLGSRVLTLSVHDGALEHVTLTSERSPPAGCAARAPWSAWDARPGESSPDTARSWWGARTCYTHLWTKPSSRLCSTCALKRMRRTSWGVESWHCPFMMGRSNMLQNSVLVPRKFGRTKSTMHQYSNRLFCSGYPVSTTRLLQCGSVDV